MKRLVIIGGGLAGSEAAYQAAERGIEVVLYEMRPDKQTPAHTTGDLAELVCSNSLGSNDSISAPGILKEELRQLGSLIIRAADETKVPAGSALAVDRELFAKDITEKIAGHPCIKLIREEIRNIPNEPVIIATGPLTSDALSSDIINLTGKNNLFFYDAISPIIDADSINWDRVFKASRYCKGGDDYVNCPMTNEEYNQFYNALMNAEKASSHDFEDARYFEGCMPIEVIAERGKDSPRYGPMKPVGLIEPKTKKEPYAVVQLRLENRFGTAYNIVGFQTKLKYGEQARVFRMIPGLENAEFLRYGSLHRNTFINAPLFLKDTLQFKKRDELFFAGQITGVEGYMESTAMGLIAGINAAKLIKGEALNPLPTESAIGSLINYITTCEPDRFQPMNINLGIMPPLEKRTRNKDEKKRLVAERAIKAISMWKGEYAEVH
ncbi:MAG: FADH(2)-oxidizing methylenetetrahydrofolate--tRNA-(uracil(54)-C(5))-methyltransferase TrmFO [Nitrospirae bacterium]|nr:FADH(2)-oxidizing methylenetetrahydrofolate--tRNA-(uracil(54)-C(5))-methyltransferase TrmFO [Nitrospirota bacterium]